MFSAQIAVVELIKQSVRYLYELVHTNFSTNFGVFTILDGKFMKITAPPGDENQQFVVHLKQ